MLKKLTIIFTLLFCFTFVACNETGTGPSKDNQTNSSSPNNEEAPSNNNEAPKEDIKLSLYDVDFDTYKISISEPLNFKGETSIEDILKEISKTISTKYFDNLTIEFVKIEKVNNKKIAVINLNESKKNIGKPSQDHKGPSWLNGFFQGSTGGFMTSKRLIENYLQNDYKGDWIDGVRFTYNNNPIDGQHVEPLTRICYRY